MPALTDAPSGTPLGEARDLVAWLRLSCEPLLAEGEPVELERLVAHLAQLQAKMRRLRDVLADAATRAGRPDLGDALRSTCAADPLLHYLLEATPEAPHETLLVWLPDIRSFDMRVVDPDRISRFLDEGDLVRHLFRCETDPQLFAAVAAGKMPSLKRLERSGAAMLAAYRTLGLRPARTPTGPVEPPSRHLGRPLGPTAADAIGAAVTSFGAQAEDTALVLDGPGT